jgi:hypothetical protein
MSFRTPPSGAPRESDALFDWMFSPRRASVQSRCGCAMSLKLELPLGYAGEQSYIVRCLMTEFLGLPFEASHHAIPCVRIHDAAGRELTIGADLFKRPTQTWLTPACLPREPLSWCDVADFRAKLLDTHLPVLYGKPSFTLGERSIHIGIDLFGGAFFFLTGLQEAVERKKDEYGRFPVTETLAFRCGILNRPIVDEYVELLWASLQRLWPGLRRRPRSFRQVLTHDIDHLRFFLARQIAGNLKRRRLDRAASDLRLWLAIKSGRAADPHDTFDLLMTVSESAGVSSTFNFITRWTNPVYDMNYVFDRPATRALLKRIAARGHTIGLHASYNAHRSAAQLARELRALKRVCDATGVQQERWGGRQHYLRWRTPDSFQNCEDAGLDYDSTLGHADAVGFRCGTCHEFPAFNLETAKELQLRERPLIAMDCTVMDAGFQNLGAGSEAFDCFTSLKDTCRHYEGAFTLLWHNNRVVVPSERALYQSIVAA